MSGAPPSGASAYNAVYLGDIFLGIVILTNLLALILLSGKVREMMDGYFERKPWEENAEAHKRWKEGQRG